LDGCFGILKGTYLACLSGVSFDEILGNVTEPKTGDIYLNNITYFIFLTLKLSKITFLPYHKRSLLDARVYEVDEASE
jgi:hypothetical protein